jgi:hypothetical protein
MSWGLASRGWQKQRPWRPPAEPPKSEWGPWWLEVLLGASLVAAVIVLIRSQGNDYLGECSFQTGYEPEVGFMRTAPALLVLVGVIETIIAASVRAGRSISRVVFEGLLVTGLSIVSLLVVATEIGRHLCD